VIHAGRAPERHLHADLARSLLHGGVHDVGDADAADHERQPADESEEELDTQEDVGMLLAGHGVPVRIARSSSESKPYFRRRPWDLLDRRLHKRGRSAARTTRFPRYFRPICAWKSRLRDHGRDSCRGPPYVPICIRSSRDADDREGHGVDEKRPAHGVVLAEGSFASLAARGRRRGGAARCPVVEEAPAGSGRGSQVAVAAWSPMSWR
jgi:hypothetical protein